MSFNALKRCLCIINTRSGLREAPSLFAGTVGNLLNTSGIVHTDLTVPQDPMLPVFAQQLPQCQLVVAAGGDGTVSSILNLLAEAALEDFRVSVRPILVVPSGRQNSIAVSLGISSAGRAVTALGSWQIADVPLWCVRLDGRTLRHVASYAAVGVYAEALARFHYLANISEEFMAIPSVGDPFMAAVASAAVWRPPLLDCDVEYTLRKAVSPSSVASEGERAVTVRGPIKGWIGAQMPMQRQGFSLTPYACYHNKGLSMLLVSAEASRLRTLHLLSREAREGDILREDGVSAVEGVASVRLHCRGPVQLFLDGEPVSVSAGSVLEMDRLTARSVPFLIG